VARVARKETWILLRTVHDLGGLKRALDKLTPPTGWLWSVQLVRSGGYLALAARIADEP